mmetsp:Transcript_103798/g.260349  ORF Transcript_103798/g.260349 Transcript_103798/m.260349 type:complete len:203 (-) Transcript_103798:65-673(-)
MAKAGQRMRSALPGLLQHIRAVDNLVKIDDKNPWFWCCDRRTAESASRRMLTSFDRSSQSSNWHWGSLFECSSISSKRFATDSSATSSPSTAAFPKAITATRRTRLSLSSRHWLNVFTAVWSPGRVTLPKATVAECLTRSSWSFKQRSAMAVPTAFATSVADALASSSANASLLLAKPLGVKAELREAKTVAVASAAAWRTR